MGWKIVFPSPRNEFLSPVPRMIDGMIAKPRPRRVAFRKRNFGWIWRSPSPWFANVHSRSSRLVGPVPVSVGRLRPETTPIGRMMPSSMPRCGRLGEADRGLQRRADQRFDRERVRLRRPAERPLPVSCNGRRAYDVTRPNERSHCPSTADELTVMNPFESIAGRKISRSTGAF